MRVRLNAQRMLVFNRRYKGDPLAPVGLSVRDVLEFATVRGAEANGLLHTVGTLTPGKEAGMVLITAEAINTMSLNNAVGTVVSAADRRNVDMVFIAGQVRKWRGNLVRYDVRRVNRLNRTTEHSYTLHNDLSGVSF